TRNRSRAPVPAPPHKIAPPPYIPIRSIVSPSMSSQPFVLGSPNSSIATLRMNVDEQETEMPHQAILKATSFDLHWQYCCCSHLGQTGPTASARFSGSQSHRAWPENIFLQLIAVI